MKFIEKIKSKSKSSADTSNIIWLPVTNCVQSNKSQDELTDRQKRMQAVIERNKLKFKLLVAQVIVVLVLYFTVIGVSISYTINNQQADHEMEHLNTYISQLSSENEALVRKVAEFEEIARDEYESKNTYIKKTVDDKSVYYGKTYKDLWCDYDSDDKAVALLSGISKIQYGTAGCSLQMMARGVDFITLSQMSETQWEEIPAYLKTLTPAQLDYLSFRVLDAYHFAQSVINREGLIADIESMGISAEAYENCTELQTVKFLSYMFTLFEENGVNYEWEKRDVISLFN